MRVSGKLSIGQNLKEINMFEVAKAWVLARWAERTTWNGTWLVGVGLVALLAKPLLDIVAWVAIGYGAYQIWKKEEKK